MVPILAIVARKNCWQSPSNLKSHIPLLLPLPADGAYIRLSLEGLAGTGALQSIELRKSPLAVSGRGCLRARLVQLAVLMQRPARRGFQHSCQVVAGGISPWACQIPAMHSWPCSAPGATLSRSFTANSVHPCRATG